MLTGAALRVLAAAATQLGLAIGDTVTSPAFPGVVCETIQVPMRDGTLLATDKYSPATAGTYPVILLRDPYARIFGSGCFKGIGGGAAGPGIDGAWGPQARSPNGGVTVSRPVIGGAGTGAG